jgi:hypothetical protein
MRFQNFLFVTILIFSIALVGCEKTEAPKNANIAKTPNANVAITNADNPLATTKTPEAATANNAPEIAPMVQKFYEALNKKDEAGVRKYLTPATIKYWENEGKSEKKTWFAALYEAETPTGEKREIRNEKIEGETALAQMKGGSLVAWTPMKFVRQNGEWKFASPEDSLSLQDMPQTDANSNKSKR